MKNNPLRYVARVTIELTTPLLIGGDEGELTDRLFVADANGLPTIPGTSLAGVLRHAMSRQIERDQVDHLFGFQGAEEGQGSHLAVSFGLIHNQYNTPVEGLIDPDLLSRDPVLASAREGVYRDHVCIGHHGAVDGDGKFDQTGVAAGNRFTFELELVGNEDDAVGWQRLLNLLASGELRLGGSTRRGFGSFRVLALGARSFDLAQADEFNAYADHPVSLSQPAKLPLQNQDRITSAELIALDLRPEGFWMFGSGDFDPTGQGTADMLPVSEERIVWAQGQGRIGAEELLIPASSIKGAIAHRCAYYARALAGQFADDLKADKVAEQGAIKPAAVVELFGDVRDDRGEEPTGIPGRVFIDDLYLDPKAIAQKEIFHVSLDRFTGGPIDGALYSEKPFFGGPILPLRIRVERPDELSAEARQTLRLTLEDLARGELPLGGGVNRGNGVFTAAINLPEWLKGGAACSTN